MSARVRDAARSVLVVGLLVALAGCSSGGSPSGAPPAPAPLAASSSPPRALSPSHSPDPAALASTGRTDRIGPVTVVLPRSFSSTGVSGNDSLRLAQFTSADPQAIIEVSRTASSASSLDDAASGSIGDSPLALARLADRVVGGQEVYAVSGSDDYTGLYYAVGRVVDGERVDVSFAFQVDSPANHALIESVLAGARWRA